MMDNFVKGVFGGILISISCLVYTKTGGGILPSVLFAFGLISILMFGASLYTGVVGYVIEKKNVKSVLTILFGNVVGCAPSLVFYNDFSAELFTRKISQNLLVVFFEAFICGIIIYLCAEAYKKKDCLWYCLIGVPAFILSGAEHSIADVACMMIGRSFSSRGLLFILVVILGNAIGSIFTNYILELNKKGDGQYE